MEIFLLFDWAGEEFIFCIFFPSAMLSVIQFSPGSLKVFPHPTKCKLSNCRSYPHHLHFNSSCQIYTVFLVAVLVLHPVCGSYFSQLLGIWQSVSIVHYQIALVHVTAVLYLLWSSQIGSFIDFLLMVHKGGNVNIKLNKRLEWKNWHVVKVAWCMSGEVVDLSPQTFISKYFWRHTLKLCTHL